MNRFHFGYMLVFNFINLALNYSLCAFLVEAV